MKALSGLIPRKVVFNLKLRGLLQVVLGKKSAKYIISTFVASVNVQQVCNYKGVKERIS